ncbi:cation transporter [Kozakia baliensis]|uniref:cation transporter n=1 Tax=Kozakia baliensis TaxID=153496 RepID=UPI00087BCCBF|nr:cation transporter [Kozakia baliensis]AOX19072.1 cobalt transporter [Kozakia baliensis]
MACSCCPASPSAENNEAPRWRRALWIALMINAGFFAAEIVMGLMAGSAALQADALDFFGDAANYAISLSVAGMASGWRSRAAMLKGVKMLAFACWVLGNTAWHAWAGTLPQAETMGVVGALALAANAGVAGMFWRFRDGDANMRSVWICARNDALGNLAVLLAALSVFGTGTGWPDVAVAAIMGGLGLHGGWQIVCHAWRERRKISHRRDAPAIPASAA